ncbi:SRPBCC family protein [Nocardiopsis protaetiae]|uniref:SRPBCC family protein n=1 Tax=Nocardiopsis protaetiae TaxID=3382270 RepID=UPI00387A904C
MYDVEVTREFNAPVGRVWEAWSTPEGIRAWWGPGPFTCPHAEVDLRPGGSALVAMRAPEEFGGGDQWAVWDFTDVEPGRRFEYVFRFTDENGAPTPPPMEGIPADGRHEVVFEDLGGRTRMRMVEHGYTTPEARDMSREGLEACLDKMDAHVTGG